MHSNKSHRFIRCLQPSLYLPVSVQQSVQSWHSMDHSTARTLCEAPARLSTAEQPVDSGDLDPEDSSDPDPAEDAHEDIWDSPMPTKYSYSLIGGSEGRVTRWSLFASSFSSSSSSVLSPFLMMIELVSVPRRGKNWDILNSKLRSIAAHIDSPLFKTQCGEVG